MIYKIKNTYFLPVLFIGIIFSLLLLNMFIKPGLTIKTVTEVYPKERWILTRGNNGQIISSMIDYSKGHTVQYSLNQFERGEFVSLKFKFSKSGENFIAKGDTIISILSSDVEDKLIAAEGEFEVAKANLKSQAAGQKESLIAEAESRLRYNNEKIKEQKVLFDRASILYAKSLISQQEYETQKWMLDLLDVEKKIYEAQIDNLSTGVKNEEIQLIESQIKSIEKRLVFLKGRINNLNILSPMTGRIENIVSPDTLVGLVNDKEVILKIPVKINDREMLNSMQNIMISFNNIENEFTGEIISITREVKFLNGQQVVFAFIKLNNTDGKFLPGMVMESLLKIKQITFFEYIKRLLTA